jgi:hypothetical protein
MGMLFNTDATLEILRLANFVFNRDGFRRLNKDQNAFAAGGAAAGTDWVTLFQSMGTGPSTYATVCGPLGLDFDIGLGGKSLRSKTWQKWLSYIDTHNSGTTTTKCSNVIGVALGAAINSNVVAAEFFAVPDTSMLVSTRTVAINGEYSLIIVVHTVTVDTIP